MLKNDSTISASSFTLMKVCLQTWTVFRSGLGTGSMQRERERERESGRTGITEVNPIMGGMWIRFCNRWWCWKFKMLCGRGRRQQLGAFSMRAGVIDSYNSGQSCLDSQFQESDLVKDMAFTGSLTKKQPPFLSLPPSLFFPLSAPFLHACHISWNKILFNHLFNRMCF